MSEGILFSRLLRGFHLLRGFPIFKGVGGNYRPVSLLSVVSKVFEKPVNNGIVDHLEKCGLFADFKCGFRSSRLTADLPTVVSERIARTFKKSRAY